MQVSSDDLNLNIFLKTLGKKNGSKSLEVDKSWYMWATHYPQYPQT